MYCNVSMSGEDYGNYPLIFSSYVFLTNMVVCWYYGYNTYMTAFLFLFITSIIFHSYNILATNIIDKFSILFVILYGSHVLFDKLRQPLQFSQVLLTAFIFATFLATALLYVYGYTCKKYCFDEDSETANMNHALLHAISSIGYHCIVLL
jgi:hypothetical protein